MCFWGSIKTKLPEWLDFNTVLQKQQKVINNGLPRNRLIAPCTSTNKDGCVVWTETPVFGPAVLMEMVDHSAEESSTHLVDGHLRLVMRTVDVEGVSGSG